jgi:hypothetical protein
MVATIEVCLHGKSPLQSSNPALQNLSSIEDFILSDPELKDPIPIEFLSHADKYAAELRKAGILVKKVREGPPGKNQDSM